MQTQSLRSTIVDSPAARTRLVRSFAALNAVLVLLLVAFFNDAVPRFARIMPGDFSHGVHSTGLWMFLSLAFLANVMGVLAVGFIVIFPALLDGVGVDERRVTRLLSENAAISPQALQACLVVVRAEAGTARRRIALGRGIILVGAAALILAFVAVCTTLVHAPPRKPLFLAQSRIVDNRAVTDRQIWQFAGDQIAGALALDIPELYDFHLGDLENNTRSRIFTDFLFAFRAILGWIALTSIIVTIRDWRSRPPKPGRARPIA